MTRRWWMVPVLAVAVAASACSAGGAQEDSVADLDLEALEAPSSTSTSSTTSTSTSTTTTTTTLPTPQTIPGDPEARILTVDDDVDGHPILHGGLVALAGPEAVVAYDIATGARAWTSPRCPSARRASVAGGRAGDRVLLDCGGVLAMLDLDDGAIAWQRGDLASSSMVRMGTGTVAVSLSDRVEVLDAADGSTRFTWRPERVLEEAMVVAVGDGVVLVGEDHRLVALDEAGNVRWGVDLVPDSVWVVDGRVLVRSPEDWFGVLDLQTGVEQSSVLIDTVVSRGSMAVGSTASTVLFAIGGANSQLYAIDTSDLTVSWRSGGGVDFVDVVDDRLLAWDFDSQRCQVVEIVAAEPLEQCPADRVAYGMDGGRLASLGTSDDGDAIVTVEPIGP